MAIKYRTAGAWGAGEGVNLTPAQVDTNFWETHLRVLELETNPPVPVNIDEIVVAGSQLTIILEDATEFGPFTLPIARFNWEGDFAAVAYVVNDFFKDPNSGGVYLVLQAHTGIIPFDPARTIGGQPAYALLLKGNEDLVIITSNTSINPTLAQANSFYQTTAAGTVGFNVPNNSTQPYPLGTTFRIAQRGAGQVEIVPIAGVTIQKNAEANGWISHRDGVVNLKKTGTNEWQLWGDLEINSKTIVPTWKGDSGDPAIGNGSIVAEAQRVGNMIWASIKVTMGSTTTFGSGDWYFELPAPYNLNAQANAVGPAYLLDSGTTYKTATAKVASGAKKIYLVPEGNVSLVDSASPFAWANGDVLELNIQIPVV